MPNRVFWIDHAPAPLLSLGVNAVGMWQRWRRYSRRMRQQLALWQQTETLPRRDLESLQLERLRHILARAATTPFYRQRLRRAKISPERLRTLEHLQDLPLLERSDLIEHSTQMMVRPYTHGVVQRKSSGTTGQPVTFYLPTHLAYTHAYAMLYQFYSWHGLEPLCRRATFAGRYLGRHRKGVVLTNWAENQLLLGVHAFRRDNVQHYVRALTQFAPQLLQAHPSAMLLLINYCQQIGITLPHIPTVCCTGESLTESDRTALAATLHAVVFSTYGLGEQCVAAGECPALQGYHLHPWTGIAETIATPNGGQEVVATSLANDVMPLIRYRTGDTVTALTHTPCPCGRTWPRLLALQGRLDDTIHTTHGHALPAVALRTEIAARFHHLPPYSLVAHNTFGRYTLRLFWPADKPLPESITPLSSFLTTRLGPGSCLTVEISAPELLLTMRGKHKVIVRQAP